MKRQECAEEEEEREGKQTQRRAGRRDLGLFESVEVSCKSGDSERGEVEEGGVALAGGDEGGAATGKKQEGKELELGALAPAPRSRPFSESRGIILRRRP